MQTTEILKRPFLWMEGSSTDAMCLLYGCRPDVLEGLREALGVPGDRFYEATGRNKVILPIGKVNFDAMPTQDAVELAFFIASVQIQMDRFLPGTPKCGGCVDIVMLRTVPRPLVHVFPGMILHHPAGKVGIQR